ncbi:THAP domain-containing 9 [Ixodes scapularis]
MLSQSVGITKPIRCLMFSQQTQAKGRPKQTASATRIDEGAGTSGTTCDTLVVPPSTSTSEHSYAVRSPHSLKQKMEDIVCHMEALQKKLKYSQEVARRLKQKVSQVEEILQDLQRQQLISNDATNVLRRTFSSTTLELCLRMLKNSRGKVTREKYPPELRSFALTLQFYSTKAYEYVRNTFQLALPHSSSIRSWYSSIDAEPGFTAEAFESLQLTVRENEKKGNKVICALLMDEMSIRKHVQWDGKKMRGFVDVGIAGDNNENCDGGAEESSDTRKDVRPQATEALVLMVVALNDHWKVPCGYFLVHGMSGAEKANLVNICLMKLHDIGVIVCCLTCDGLQSNWTMFRTLGAELEDPEEMRPWFPHPATSDQRVFILMDICHMLKLLRNALASLQVIKDPDGRSIRWLYIERLNKLQEEQGLRAGNKLRPAHMEWDRQKMKVNLAAQVISSSVADALEFCNIDLKDQTFTDSEATVKFIRIFDKLFDMMNSRNPLAKNFKAPLKMSRQHLWKPSFEEAARYILGLKDVRGQLLYLTRRKTAFVGFLVAMKTFEGLCETLLGGPEPLMRYLLTYKCSQDHLELFFGAIRSKGGWNNNPTALQFRAAYKRLLVRHEVQQVKGNSTVQDATSILHVSTKAAHRDGTNHEGTLEDYAVARRFGLVISPREEDHDYVYIPNATTLSLYVENVVEYIAGYVVRMLRKKVACPNCLAALQEQSETGGQLLRRKNRGGLLVPSSSVQAICKSAEKCVRRLEPGNNASKELVQQPRLEAAIVCAVLHNLAEERTEVFKGLDDHMYDTEPDNNHVVRLTKLTASCYLKIRLHHQARRLTEQSVGPSIRSKNLRTVILLGQ